MRLRQQPARREEPAPSRSIVLRAALIVLLLQAAIAGRADAQVAAGEPGEGLELTNGLLVRLGTDTMAIERFARNDVRMEGELLRRIPSTHIIRYVVTLDDGIPREFTFTITRPTGTPEPPSAVRGGRIIFGEDAARIELDRDSVHRHVVPAAHAFPMLPESYALYELWLSLLRRSDQDSIAIMVVAPMGGITGRIRAMVLGADSVLVRILGGSMRLRIDRQGVLFAVDGGDTPIKFDVERIPAPNITALSEVFAATDAAGGAFGTWISPRDTVTASLGAAGLWVDYGRPAARGRDVFGHGVLGDTLWRTGANAATQFRTDTDLLIGGEHIPAGTYTLWTRYDSGHATLIINTQIGQWGTQYDRTRDLVRIPLEVRRIDGRPVELLTIDIRPVDGTGRGALDIRWDRTLMTAPVEVIGPPDNSTCRTVATVLGGVAGFLAGAALGGRIEQALYSGEDAGLTGALLGGAVGAAVAIHLGRRACGYG